MQQSVASYNDPGVVQLYTGLKNLFPPEVILFGQPDLQATDMLDIGIGGGRTTRYFIDKVRSYTGVDFAASMVAYCRQEFASVPTASFLEMDARNLQFNNESFDLVLFSFNGIDSVEEAGRLQILKEVFRVLRKGGRFIFSFHNMQSVDRMFSLQLPKNPFNWAAEIKRFRNLRKNNPDPATLKTMDVAAIKDGVNHDYNLSVMYVQPAYQLARLQDTGFRDISMYDFKGRALAPSPEALAGATDYWIHVLCHK